MKSFICLVAIIACVCAQEFQYAAYDDIYPEFYLRKEASRQRRDVTWDKQVGNSGKVFGTLGQDDNGLFGRGGYNHEVFNDHRGKLNAQAYGSRVLGPYGDSTHFGGKLDWADRNARAGLDLSKTVGGHTGLRASGDGLWNMDKNTRFSAGGFYQQPFLGHGRPDYGLQAQFNRNF